MCHPNYAKTWQEIVGTPYAPNSNQNTINTEYNVVSIKANRYLTNVAAYYLIGDPQGLNPTDGQSVITSHKYIDEVWTWFDDQSRAWNISDEFRSTFGARDWRGTAASPGAGP
jgi:hypothetical protein